jgi:hypothetical protein
MWRVDIKEQVASHKHLLCYKHHSATTEIEGMGNPGESGKTGKSSQLREFIP